MEKDNNIKSKDKIFNIFFYTIFSLIILCIILYFTKIILDKNEATSKIYLSIDKYISSDYTYIVEESNNLNTKRYVKTTKIGAKIQKEYKVNKENYLAIKVSKNSIFYFKDGMLNNLTPKNDLYEKENKSINENYLKNISIPKSFIFFKIKDNSIFFSDLKGNLFVFDKNTYLPVYLKYEGKEERFQYLKPSTSFVISVK